MSKEALKNLIELVPDSDIETLYKVVIKFIPEDEASNDEIESIEEAKKDIKENGTISHNSIEW